MFTLTVDVETFPQPTFKLTHYYISCALDERCSPCRWLAGGIKVHKLPCHVAKQNISKQNNVIHTVTAVLW